MSVLLILVPGTSIYSSNQIHLVVWFTSYLKNLLVKLKPDLNLPSGTGVLVGVVAIIVFWQHKKRKVGHPNLMTENDSFDCSPSEVEEGSIYLDVPLFSYSELIEATDNFDQSKVLGTGGHGIVYYGNNLEFLSPSNKTF